MGSDLGLRDGHPPVSVMEDSAINGEGQESEEPVSILVRLLAGRPCAHGKNQRCAGIQSKQKKQDSSGLDQGICRVPRAVLYKREEHWRILHTLREIKSGMGN